MKLSSIRASVARQRQIWDQGHRAARHCARRGYFTEGDGSKTAATIAMVRRGDISLDGSDNDFWVHAAREAGRQEAAAGSRPAGRKAG